MTIRFDSPIFGPVHSRRLGTSLGINLLPHSGKVCNFDCIYCECGYNKDYKTTESVPSRKEVKEKLEKQLVTMKEQNNAPDVITFAGNGEPTLHPQFEYIIDDTIRLRDYYFPNAKVCVLSNATRINRPSVFNALQKVDQNILKLDTVDWDFIQLVNRPSSNYSLDETIEKLKLFGDSCIIQTMFLKGFYEGRYIDNTAEKYVLPWIEVVKDINPERVMVYTIDRDTPDKDLVKASPKELDSIVDLLKKEGLQAEASY